jgi:2-keto-4-pentenoate hydratase
MSASNSEAVATAAARLAEARDARVGCAPILDLIAPGDIASAYAVQEIGTAAALAAGELLVGRKIGLTARAVQTQLGVDQPDYGMLFDTMAVDDGAPVPTGKLIQPKVEAEIAFVMDRDLDSPGTTLAEAARAVAYALPAIEIVDSRIADWKISIVDTIADNASSGMFVLGGSPTRIDAFDLRLCGMVLEEGGEGLSFGCGAACLGNPLVALAWLARTMARVGRPIRAGEVILSGALGPMVPALPGKTYEVRIHGLGSVRAAFAGEAQ